MFRQGDLLFVKATEIPKDATKTKDRILARGEATGHTHRVSPESKATVLVAGALLYIRALRETEILHEEHKTIILPPGDWVMKRQREYEPEGWRYVQD